MLPLYKDRCFTFRFADDRIVHRFHKPYLRMNLLILDGIFGICKIDANAPIPAWATTNDFLSITRTAQELSVVCRQNVVPEGIVCERGWRCLRVAGAIPFAAVGVLCSLITPLAESGISVFAVSTFDTDYLMVKENRLQTAIVVLQKAGHSIAN